MARLDAQLPQHTQVMRGDAIMQALDGMTPAQLDAWIETNVTNLASAKGVLKALVKVVKYLVETGVIKGV